MAVRSARESTSSVVQVSATAATAAVLLLGYLVFKTLSFDLSGHQQRLESLSAVGRLDAEMTQIFLRRVAGGTPATVQELQGANQRLATAVEALQQGEGRLTGLDADIDTAMSDYLDLLIRKFEQGREFDAQHRLVQQEAEKGYDAPAPRAQAAALAGFAKLPTEAALQAVERVYQRWLQARIDEGGRYRSLLAGYTVALLLALGYLGFRLRLSYRALNRANAELSEANRTLETQVQARTKELSDALTHLKESQAQLVQSEKMASLGQLVAGVAHEINTPLGYARSNADIVRTTLADIRQLCALQSHALQLLASPLADAAKAAQAITAAKAAQQATPVAELLGELDTLLADTDYGLLQIADLVASLKDFSRLDRSRHDHFDLNAGLESALKICHSQLKGRIEVVRQFAPLPEVECAPSQINQVFLNLITNAAQAIEGEGRIKLATAVEDEMVVVRITDTGSGMTPEVQQRIFEPFFTTKPVGQGTGLGLSIVYRIIEEHGGRISVRSKPGVGTRFSVRLPLRQKAGAA